MRTANGDQGVPKRSRRSQINGYNPRMPGAFTQPIKGGFGRGTTHQLPARHLQRMTKPTLNSLEITVLQLPVPLPLPLPLWLLLLLAFLLPLCWCCCCCWLLLGVA